MTVDRCEVWLSSRDCIQDNPETWWHAMLRYQYTEATDWEPCGYHTLLGFIPSWPGSQSLISSLERGSDIAHPQVLTRASAPGTQVGLASWTSWHALQQGAAGCPLHICVLDGDVFIVLCGSGWLPPKRAWSTNATMLQQTQQAEWHVHRPAVKKWWNWPHKEVQRSVCVQLVLAVNRGVNGGVRLDPCPIPASKVDLGGSQT